MRRNRARYPPAGFTRPGPGWCPLITGAGIRILLLPHPGFYPSFLQPAFYSHTRSPHVSDDKPGWWRRRHWRLRGSVQFRERHLGFVADSTESQLSCSRSRPSGAEFYGARSASVVAAPGPSTHHPPCSVIRAACGATPNGGDRRGGGHDTGADSGADGCNPRAGEAWCPGAGDQGESGASGYRCARNRREARVSSFHSFLRDIFHGPVFIWHLGKLANSNVLGLPSSRSQRLCTHPRHSLRYAGTYSISETHGSS